MIPLPEIAARLFGAAPDATVKLPQSTASPDESTTDARLPSPRLRAALAARQRHQQALRGQPQRGGIVVRIRHEGYGPLEDDTPINVLLDAVDADGLWRGWIVTPDAEYAADRDLVVQAADGDMPDAAVRVVQCWNPVLVTHDMLGHPLQDLGPALLVQARRLATQGSASAAAQPGRLARRPELPDAPVTGTPLAAADPRRDYQHLYRTAACYVTAAAQAQRGGAARKEVLLAGIARQMKHFGRAAGAAWPLQPQMEDPVPETLGYQLGDAFSLRVEPLPDGNALFSVAPLTPGAHAAVLRDRHPLASNDEDGCIRLPIACGHDYQIEFSRTADRAAASLRLHC